MLKNPSGQLRFPFVRAHYDYAEADAPRLGELIKGFLADQPLDDPELEYPSGPRRGDHAAEVIVIARNGPTAR